jgi:CDP-paratose 2-epimerase
MRLLITGVCGFVGSVLAENLLERGEGLTLCGIDNQMRPGSEGNRARLKKMGVDLVHGDIRSASDFEALPKSDWVIDAAANPSVLAGVRGRGSSRQLFEHNLASVGNVLEYCKLHGAGLLLLSTSRVYSIPKLAGLPLRLEKSAFHLDPSGQLPRGVSTRGISTEFSTEAPVSLYGSMKLASEAVALEYGAAFGFPVWITRCGVLAGPGQFGTPEQGIFSYWLNAHLRRRPLCYLGFEGTGHQVRDSLHPCDLAVLLERQMRSARTDGQRIYTAGGGPENSMSLAQLTAWCDARFGPHTPGRDAHQRPYDVPWVIMDNSDAERDFGWRPKIMLNKALEQIAAHAERHPEWLELSNQ